MSQLIYRLAGFMAIFVGISIFVGALEFELGSELLGPLFLFGMGIVIYSSLYRWLGATIFVLGFIALFEILFAINIAGIVFGFLFLYFGVLLFRGKSNRGGAQAKSDKRAEEQDEEETEKLKAEGVNKGKENEERRTEKEQEVDKNIGKERFTETEESVKQVYQENAGKENKVAGGAELPEEETKDSELEEKHETRNTSETQAHEVQSVGTVWSSIADLEKAKLHTTEPTSSETKDKDKDGTAPINELDEQNEHIQTDHKADSTVAKDSSAQSRDKDEQEEETLPRSTAPTMPIHRRKARTTGSKKNSSTVHNQFIGDFRYMKNQFELHNMNMSYVITDIKMDLSKAIIPEGESSIAISGVFGDVDIYVPPDLDVSIATSVTVGNFEILGHKQSGINRQIKLATKGYEQSARKVKISVSLFVGDVDVRFL
ncbi:cell wall-active antibiotics response protein LiaF [Bacillus horti]|uniref:Membrane protein n=1 Tax=Caldalkalibacillus horti TaxID=77523 RepID=A0ABT9W1G1_9BACI|nr:cell wall-active antibiotics response protein LiaF [Bacillus horti]MDQ0167093.1 putative membrane protein [Bacillus horti]